jgi:diacylglycerol kinase (ATP)
VLGWGKGYEDEDVEEILRDVEHSQLTMLDRWKVQVEHQRYLGLRRRGRELTMNNYLGIGCGAGVALNFHRQRESRPLLFTSRIINKVGVVGSEVGVVSESVYYL